MNAMSIEVPNNCIHQKKKNIYSITHPRLIGSTQTKAVGGAREQTAHSALQIRAVIDLGWLRLTLPHHQTVFTHLTCPLRGGTVWHEQKSIV